MRVSTTGGTPELVVQARISGLSCARSGDSCAIAEQTRDGRTLVFTELHPLKGRGRELARFEIDHAGIYYWDVSPDGSRIAVLKALENDIHLIAVTGGRVIKTIAVKGSSGLQHLIWQADGTGFLSSTQMRGSAVLLSVDLQGNPRVLWQQPGGRGTYAVPSRDGRHLAIMDLRATDNVWMLENF
jgi:hypothetical protein